MSATATAAAETTGTTTRAETTGTPNPWRQVNLPRFLLARAIPRGVGAVTVTVATNAARARTAL